MKEKTAFRPLAWLVCALLALAAFVLRFLLPGYSFSALVCCCLIGIIAFYEITRMLREKHPRPVKLLRRIFTACLILGLLVVGATEAVIIRYSLGNPEEPVDYVVVLGAKIRDIGPSASLWDRIHGAYDYLAAHPDVTAVLSGGQGADEPIPEAQAMYDELVKLGIDENRLWMEDQATSTWENLNFSLDLIEAKTGVRPETLGIISSEYHLFRSSLFARKCGVDFVGIPAKTTQPGQKINHFMREVAGVWHFLILGGQYD